jgi:hypothetical protein
MLGKYVGVLGARTYFRGSAKPIDPAHSRYRLVIDGMEGDFKARVRGIFGGLISPPVIVCAASLDRPPLGPSGSVIGQSSHLVRQPASFLPS